MKKSLTRKLTIAVIALVFAVVSLSTSTYAWFTMSNTAQINAFEAEVKAGEGIEIAVSPTSDRGSATYYTGQVPSSVIQNVANPKNGDGEYDFKFDALTPTKTGYNGFEFTNIETGTASTGWISFFVHIKSANAGYIYLEDIDLASVTNKFTVDAPFKVAAAGAPTDPLAVNSQIEYAVENAARVAVFSQNELYKYVYEKEAEDFVPAEGENVAKAGNTEGFCVNNIGAVEYYNTKNSTTISFDQGNKKYEADQITDLTSSKKLLGQITDTTTPLTIQVVIWIEGWDAECLNAIFAQKLSTALSFKYYKEQIQ